MVVKMRSLLFLIRLIMKSILCFSGGKDSMATAILCRKYGIPLTDIVFVEVMYDLTRNISGENRLHLEFLHNVAFPKLREWGYNVHIVRGDKDYLTLFNHVVEKPVKNMGRKGLCSGFPLTKMCCIKRDCKVRVLSRYLDRIAGGEMYTKYIGICVDEPLRLSALGKDKQSCSVLAELGYTQEMAMQLCSEYGLLSPTYKNGNRGGCWFCPNAKLYEHKEIFKNEPDLWDEFVALEMRHDIANPVYSCYGQSLAERDVLVRL